MRAVVLILALALTGCATMSGQAPPPDAEVGVAFDRNGEVASFAEGIADPQSHRAVTPDDPVRVASISKLVTTIGVMKLVDSGRLDLDADVSHVLGYSLRNPAFPDRPVTLEMLLSHTSSVRDHNDQYAIPLDGTVAAVMADPRSWDSARGPGDNHFDYANMNFPIVGSIIERVTGERFDRWMKREVLDPMKLNACFNWASCSDGAIARAVELDGPDGKPVKDDLHGIRPDCPVFTKASGCDLSAWVAGANGALFAPQGGLRISARDLARVGRMLLGEGTFEGVRILSAQAVETMLAPRWRFDGGNGATLKGFFCSYGLASQQIPTRRSGCIDDPGTRGAALVGHVGDAYGFRGGLWIDRSRNLGIVYFVTGLAEGPPRAPDSAFAAAEQHAFRRTYALLPR